jgi:hypothetical protein
MLVETLFKYLIGDTFDKIYFLKKYWHLDTSGWPGPTMGNLRNPWYKILDSDKTMEPIMKQIRWSNYNGSSIKSWKRIKTYNLKKHKKGWL